MDDKNDIDDKRPRPHYKSKKSLPEGITRPLASVRIQPDATPRKYIVTQRKATPEVTSMIADAYHVIDQQLAQFRARASIEQFDVKDLTGLHKLVCTLKILEDGEDRRIKAYNLSGLSKESLELLEAEAAKYGAADKDQ